MTTFLGVENPTARKVHHCDFCDRAISPGETYQRQRNVGDDGLYSYKLCAHCRAMIPLLEMDQLDWCGEGYTADAMLDYQPRSVAEARLVVMWRRKWARRDGSRYPVPEATS